MQFLRHPARRNSRSLLACRVFPRLEQLETRIVPYTVTGSAWPNPQLITLSFEPDGTAIGGGNSNLFATLNARYPTSMWENQIIKAAQVWAQQTNINFQVIGDSGVEQGSGNYQQGDPTMGDIRIGGVPLGITNEPLAFAFLPPPSSNYSIAGDIEFNTSYSWVINSSMGYDLFTVAAHEIGHALGLGESAVYNSVMYGSYTITKTGLYSDDITGIRTIYSNGNPRSYDSFNDANTSFSTAANLTSLINQTSLTALETGLDISTTSQKEYFSITAPQGTSSTMTVTVQSTGLSLLAPSLSVYNSSQTLIASTSGSGELGNTISLNITGVSAGQQYYVVVGGANTTSFGTGDYAMTFQFGSTAPPAVPLPNTQVLDGIPSYCGNTVPDLAGDPDGDSGTLANFAHPAAAAVPPQAPAPSASEMLLVGTTKAAAGVTPLSAAASATALPLTSALFVVSPTFLPTHANLARLESGSGSEAVDALFEQNAVQPSLPSTDESEAPAAADEEPLGTTAAQTALPSVSWPQAADAYFTDAPLMADSTGTSQVQATACDQEFTPLFEAAAAAALALTLEPKGLKSRDHRLQASGRPVRRLFRF